MADRGRGLRYWLEDKAIRGVFWSLLRLPYETRVRVMGWVTATLIAPLIGYDKRIRANLAHACPDLPEAEIRRLVRAVPNTVGRALIESYSGAEFTDRLRDTPIEGPGLAALNAARDEHRTAILVTGHFANYDAARAALKAQGHAVAGLYNPMKNAYFNDHYTATMAAIADPIFPRGRRGLTDLMRHLKSGGIAGLLVDQFMRHGEMLTFFGQPAPTALSAAELALRFKAPLIPIYAIRQPDGLSFRVGTEAPIPPTDPATRTQALNDSLEVRVRANMEQWFWIHRRWKPERHARIAALRANAAQPPQE